MLCEIHMLKNFPPANLNRDDAGTPKTCVFNGTTRGRISSQCLKNSWRRSKLFRSEIENVFSISLSNIIVDKLKAGNGNLSDEVIDIVFQKILEFENALFADEDVCDKINKESDNMCDEIKKVVSEKKAGKITKKVLKQTIDEATTLRKKILKLTDTALFGQTVTPEETENMESSLQVAHAISTNKITVESDYFTAMDDLLDGDTIEESGAAKIDATDYNCSCYYIYVSIDTDVLRANLMELEDVDDVVRRIIPIIFHTIAFTNPSGKQNSFAGNILPSAIMVDCKGCKIPISLVNAYRSPVHQEWKKDLVENSILKLKEEADKEADPNEKKYYVPIKKRIWFCVDKYKETIELQKEKSIKHLEETNEVTSEQMVSSDIKTAATKERSAIESVICDTFDDMIEEVIKTLADVKI